MTKVSANPLLRDYAGKTVVELGELFAELGSEVPKGAKPVLIAALDVLAAVEQQDAWASLASTVVKRLPKVERFEPSGLRDAENSIQSALQTAYKKHVEADALQGTVRSLEEELEGKLQKDAEAIRDHIRARCGDIGEVEILPAVSFSSGLKSTQISVTGKKGEDIHLGEAGAGRARRVSLAVWEYTTGLLDGAGDVVLLYDEPDTHLDYKHQRDFMRVVRDQSRLPNVRMVIATHSMNLIDGVDIGDVIHIKHVDHRTVADQLGDTTEVGQHLGAVAASLGLRNTVLLHERLFVGVEGPTETAALPVLFKTAMGQQLESCGIAIWACRNNEGAADFASFLVKHGRSVAFLVDADSRNVKHVFSEGKLRQRGLDPDKHALYIGAPNEIEDLFSDAQWAQLANAQWPREDQTAWTKSHFASLREKKFSKDLLTELREQSLDGPSGKPDVMVAMALHVKSPEDVPEQLRDAFQALIELAI
ncbi:ATP-dependent nuclease [Cryobacterium psychrophilum]|uniref:ATP-dependent nuclease n=1 Tax=Cryobacterium psychrophilum TaxID=41988 RepID=UPI0010650CEA|nr:TOPRIM nucleotidyl transferase/hydrolase domain-containing protein [Cryobacterium psychrophilum]TDW29188.1 hypothetical protein EDD25_0874 [Cryobacterium psychrophilum]